MAQETGQEERSIQNMFPFAFPGAIEEKEIVEPPPLHPELEDWSFFELFAKIFDMMKPGEKLSDVLKRLKQGGDNLDEIAKYVSELYSRGETDIFERDWTLIGISAGRIGKILDTKWEVKTEGKISEPMMSLEITPKARVLAAMDSEIREVGTEEWIPIEKINFATLKL